MHNDEMTLADYQEDSQKFVVDTFEPALLNWIIGLSGEAGEVAELIKKSVIRKGEYPDLFKLQEELGDVLFYLTQIATTAGITLEGVAKYNLQKLEKRHGGKKF